MSFTCATCKKVFSCQSSLSRHIKQVHDKIKIHTPLISLTKAEIILAGTKLNVDYKLTHSCYDPSIDGLSCGECDACILRKEGFASAGINDPTNYI